MTTVSSLHIYPIKSCRGHSVERATFDIFGFTGDRRFLVVDERGHLLTQRATPRLALIEPTVFDGRITLRAPEMESIEVATARSGAESIDVVVWRDTCRALDLGGAVSSWLTVFLEQPARLVTLAPEYRRDVHKPAALPTDQVAFADACPLLIISEETLAALNARLDFALPMNRFRPNIVLRGGAAHDEDKWPRIRIGHCVLRAAGPCDRCVIPTIDQETLERSKEPLRTLASYRRSESGEVFFGQNFINETKVGEIVVGMPVEILS